MRAPHLCPPLDFDQWAVLAREDPQAFESIRAQVIENAICRAPARNRQRLRCLQWKLDQIRHTSRTPMVACLRINRLLWDAVAGNHGLLAHLARTQATPCVARRRQSAKILPFRGQALR